MPEQPPQTIVDVMPHRPVAVANCPVCRKDIHHPNDALLVDVILVNGMYVHLSPCLNADGAAQRIANCVDDKGAHVAPDLGDRLLNTEQARRYDLSSHLFDVPVAMTSDQAGLRVVMKSGALYQAWFGDVDGVTKPAWQASELPPLPGTWAEAHARDAAEAAVDLPPAPGDLDDDDLPY